MSKPFEPSPKEIRSACTGIRATWSPKILNKRRCLLPNQTQKKEPYTIPEIRVRDIPEEETDE